MIRPILIYGNPKLRESSVVISQFGYMGLDILIADMFETIKNADGVGLAAPQIGLNIRLIIVNIEEENFKKAFINPDITFKSDNLVSEIENCLSLPNLAGPVERPDKIEIVYANGNLKYQKESFEGLKARVIQHEIDHLDGVLWIDHLGENRKLINEPLEYIKNMNVKVNYPIL